MGGILLSDVKSYFAEQIELYVWNNKYKFHMSREFVGFIAESPVLGAFLGIVKNKQTCI